MQGKQKIKSLQFYRDCISGSVWVFFERPLPAPQAPLNHPGLFYWLSQAGRIFFALCGALYFCPR